MGDEEKEQFLQRKKTEVRNRYRQKQVRRKWGFYRRTEVLKETCKGKAWMRKNEHFAKE